MNQIIPNRRRFMALVAALPTAAALPSFAAPERVIRGQGMGAQISLRLHHPEADRLGALALTEVARLEAVFSLYRPDSALVRLNQTGVLDAPPAELLECLTLCGAVHHASGGAFDPTIQPLWAVLAESHAAGQAPDPARIAAARRLVGWQRIKIDSGQIRLSPGMALTLNGVAQGVVADHLARLMRREGLELGLIDAGEIAAIGRDWPVRIENGPRLRLTNRALATSGPFGTVLDGAGLQGHILSPLADAAPPLWQGVTVSAPRAALADALSTAACLMPRRDAVLEMLARFGDVRLEHLSQRA
jgi:thiamine biosynthesis lipoprotein